MSRFERLNFPDGPRSDLERTIEDLVDSAHRVLATQGRLRHLLDANRSVVEELDLEQVLRRIVEAAVSLVDAEYGALGVIAPDGHLEQFIHVGIPGADVAAIGQLPRGHGLLGAVIDAAGPIRLDHLDRDPRSSGFPAHHPTMDGFLGVPIRVRNEVYGNLYLTNRADGAFSQEDEDLVTALAATAGIAIDNARLFDDSQRRHRWATATAEVASAILVATPGEVWDVVADHLHAVVDGDAVRVVGYDEADDAVRGDPEAAGPSIEVPLAAAGTSLGVVTLARATGAREFSAVEVDLASEFAAQATVAIELARGRADTMALQLVDDRSRIARDLHDHVIQRLFASGLTLQSLIARVPSELRGSLSEQVDAIDSAIAQIRTAVFTLASRADPAAPGLRSQVLEVVSEVTPHLPSTPRLAFSGPVDLTIGGDLASDVVAVIREGLTNIARHAQATESSVDVSIVGDEVLVRLEDDGRGIPPETTRSSGTSNLAERAAHHGGGFALEPRTPRGTVLLWRATLRGDQ